MVKGRYNSGPFNAPLTPWDTEFQTKGCRHTNPDNCGSNLKEGVCAFVTADGICLRPSRAWKKQFLRLRDNDKKFTL